MQARTRFRSPSASGALLIGLGVLLMTGWWWPGTLLVIGVALAIEYAAEGRVFEGVGLATLLLAIPILILSEVVAIVRWSAIGPFVLLGLGIAYIYRGRGGGW